jgi:hypothetical protein
MDGCFDAAIAFVDPSDFLDRLFTFKQLDNLFGALEVEIEAASVLANALSSNAAGRINSSLLRREPIAILAIIGDSRSDGRPTYPGVTAASSITTPTVLLPARTAAAVTSSADAAASRASAALALDFDRAIGTRLVNRHS